MKIMEKETQRETAYEGHEKRIKRLEDSLRNEQIGKAYQAVGAAGGAAVGYKALGEYAKGLGEFVGEAWHSIDLAGKVASNYFESRESLDKYLQHIDVGVRESYAKNLKDESLVSDISREALEAMQRASAKMPGAESKAVKGIAGLKTRIIEGTKALLADEKGKEEITIQASEEYARKYDALAELRMAIIEKREVLKAKMKEQAKKLEHSEYNTGNVDLDGVKILEGLIREYNTGCELLRGIGSLDVKEINAGKLNSRYNGVVSQVEKYRVKPYDAGNWGDAGVMGVTIAGAYLGYKIAKPLTPLVRGGFYLGKQGIKFGKKAVKLANRGTMALVGKIQKKLNSRKEKKDDGNREDKSA